MKPGLLGFLLFAVGSLLLVALSPLYSPDLALVPPGPVTLPRYAVLYYLPRIVLSGILLAGSVNIIFTEAFSKLDRYWAYSMVGAVLISWLIWLRE